MLTIRPYADADATQVLAIHNATNPDNTFTLSTWRWHIRAVTINGRAWVIGAAQEPLGYAASLPVPGLPGVVELSGGVSPAHQRAGIGSQMVRHICRVLAGSEVHQLSYPASSLQTAAARFLQKNGYFREHQEWMMALELRNFNDRLTAASRQSSPFDLRLATHDRHTAVSLFCQLYPACFSGTPWNQPYTAAEVYASLQKADDLQFLYQNKEPVGFVWVQPHTARQVQLEPVGIIQAKQQQGLGRWLLTAVLQKLSREKIQIVQLGVWANNKPAYHLYQSLGFAQQSTLTYLAFDL